MDTDRSDDVVSYGLGAGAIVTGLAIFAYATKKDKTNSRTGKS